MRSKNHSTFCLLSVSLVDRAVYVEVEVEVVLLSISIPELRSLDIEQVEVEVEVEGSAASASRPSWLYGSWLNAPVCPPPTRRAAPPFAADPARDAPVAGTSFVTSSSSESSSSLGSSPASWAPLHVLHEHSPEDPPATNAVCFWQCLHPVQPRFAVDRCHAPTPSLRGLFTLATPLMHEASRPGHSCHLPDMSPAWLPPKGGARAGAGAAELRPSQLRRVRPVTQDARLGVELHGTIHHSHFHLSPGESYWAGADEVEVEVEVGVEVEVDFSMSRRPRRSRTPPPARTAARGRPHSYRSVL